MKTKSFFNTVHNLEMIILDCEDRLTRGFVPSPALFVKDETHNLTESYKCARDSWILSVQNMIRACKQQIGFLQSPLNRM